MRKPTPVRDAFIRGVTVGVVSMSVLTIGYAKYQTMDAVRFTKNSGTDQTVFEQPAAHRAAGLVTKALLLSQEVMNREITHDDVPGIINGALSSLDPYSGYIGKEFIDRLQVGDTKVSDRLMIGVIGASRADGYYVTSTIPGSPAEFAGLVPQDRLVKIEDTSVHSLSGKQAFEKLQEAIQLSEGREMQFEFLRGKELKHIRMTPDLLDEEYATDMGTKEGILHIHVQGFYNGVADGVDRIISRAQKNGHLRGIVFDMRGNAGGLVRETIKMAELVMPDNTVLFAEDGLHVEKITKKTTHPAKYSNLKLAVIVDQNSASASEIFASAVQSNDLGKVIGQVSYGKGTIQNIYPLDEPGSAVKITVGEYKDAKGRSIQGIGVIPDVFVEPNNLGPESDPYLAAAIESMRF